MTRPDEKHGLNAVTSASEKVVQCVPSAGVPPLKWNRVDHVRDPPRYGMVTATLSDGVAAMDNSMPYGVGQQLTFLRGHAPSEKYDCPSAATT